MESILLTPFLKSWHMNTLRFRVNFLKTLTPSKKVTRKYSSKRLKKVIGRVDRL